MILPLRREFGQPYLGVGVALCDWLGAAAVVHIPCMSAIETRVEDLPLNKAYVMIVRFFAVPLGGIIAVAAVIAVAALPSVRQRHLFRHLDLLFQLSHPVADGASPVRHRTDLGGVGAVLFVVFLIAYAVWFLGLPAVHTE